MRQRGERLRLDEKIGVLARVQQLDRDVALERRIVREVDEPHAAGADLPDDPVAPDEVHARASLSAAGQFAAFA